jgi:hypothetical protein
MNTMTHRTTILTACLLVGLLVLTACGTDNVPKETPQQDAQPCTTKDCFITAARACMDARLTLTEEAGTFTYTSTTTCTFTKTLDEPNPAESAEMKTLLRGKSLTCQYTTGTFDERWVTTLLTGTDACTGTLKDTLVELSVFA